MSPYASMMRGIVVGTVVGILFAPKPGLELREDIRGWFNRTNDRGRSIVQRFLDLIPMRVKAAAGIGAVRGAGRQLVREAGRKIRS